MNQLKQEPIEIKDEKKEMHEVNFFKPCYNASFIGSILIRDKYSEKEKLNFLKKYEPFSKYWLEAQIKNQSIGKKASFAPTPMVKSSLNQINAKLGTNFIKPNCKYVDFGHFGIAGFPDGIDILSKQILKIRTMRMGSLLPPESEIFIQKERVQVLSLLKIFDCKSCLFVETNPQSVFLEEPNLLYFDEEEYDTIFDRLMEFTWTCRVMSHDEFTELFNRLLFIIFI